MLSTKIGFEPSIEPTGLSKSIKVGTGTSFATVSASVFTVVLRLLMVVLKLLAFVLRSFTVVLSVSIELLIWLSAALNPVTSLILIGRVTVALGSTAFLTGSS